MSISLLCPLCCVVIKISFIEHNTRSAGKKMGKLPGRLGSGLIIVHSEIYKLCQQFMEPSILLPTATLRVTGDYSGLEEVVLQWPVYFGYT